MPREYVRFTPLRTWVLGALVAVGLYTTISWAVTGVQSMTHHTSACERAYSKATCASLTRPLDTTHFRVCSFDRANEALACRP